MRFVPAKLSVLGTSPQPPAAPPPHVPRGKCWRHPPTPCLGGAWFTAMVNCHRATPACKPNACPMRALACPGFASSSHRWVDSRRKNSRRESRDVKCLDDEFGTHLSNPFGLDTSPDSEFHLKNDDSESGVTLLECWSRKTDLRGHFARLGGIDTIKRNAVPSCYAQSTGPPRLKQ